MSKRTSLLKRIAGSFARRTQAAHRLLNGEGASLSPLRHTLCNNPVTSSVLVVVCTGCLERQERGLPKLMSEANSGAGWRPEAAAVASSRARRLGIRMSTGLGLAYRSVLRADGRLRDPRRVALSRLIFLESMSPGRAASRARLRASRGLTERCASRLLDLLRRRRNYRFPQGLTPSGAIAR